MAILNYRTEISAEKSIGEIQARLAKAGAQAIMSEYEQGVLSQLSFRISTQHGVMSFRMPANIDGVYKLLQANKKLSGKEKSREQAARVAWRIIKDWIEAQLAIIEADMATLAQVFLPYAQTKLGGGLTLYELVESRGMNNLLTFERGENDA